MITSKKIFFLCGLMLLASSCNNPTTALSPAYNYNRQMEIDGQTLSVEVATTPATMQQGLSDRPSMGESQGMLFDFGSSVMPSFWMKDMDFKLDFIWIRQNKIVGITPDVPAPVNCKLLIVNCSPQLPYYYPPSDVNQVLEVNAGWAEKNNLKIGDETLLK
jgi:uncharacterized protein